MKYVLSVLLLALAVLCGARPTAIGRDRSEILLTSAVQDNKTWTDCSKPTDHGKIESVVIDPNPPKRGQPVAVYANGTIDETLSGGKITVTIMFGPFPYTQDYDLCEGLTLVDQSCPLQPGSHTMSYKTTIADNTPTGEYKGNALAKDQNGERVFCANFDFTI